MVSYRCKVELSKPTKVNLGRGSTMTKKAENKKCPVCGEFYQGVGALSRKDNGTEICSKCG